MSLAALVVVVSAGVAHAQSAEAERLFQEGAASMEAGDYAKACEAFAASNRIEPRAGTLLRLGDCREKNQQFASAWSAFTDALGRAQDPGKREIAQAHIAALTGRLSNLTVDVPEASRLAGLVITRGGVVVDYLEWNRGAPIDGGDYEIVARAPGHEPWTTRVTVAPERAQVVVLIPRLKSVAPTGGIDTVRMPMAETPPLLTNRRRIALGVAGAGAVFLAVGVFNGRQVADLEGQAHDLCGTDDDVCADFATANGYLEDARSKARLANLSFGLGAVSVAGAAVLWFTGGARTSAGAVITPTVTPGGVGAVMKGTF